MTIKKKKSAALSSYLQKYIKSPCAGIALILFITNVILINSICVQFSGEDLLDKPEHTIVKRSASNHSMPDKNVNLFFKKRQKALLDSPNKKVLVLGYNLGGSSYIGDVFNHNPEAVYWFEPLSAFYQAYYGLGGWPKPFDILVHRNLSVRSLPVTEHRHIGRFMQYLFSCDTDHISPQTLGHRGLHYQYNTKDFYTCITEHNAQGHNCSNHLQSKCKGNFDNAVMNNCNKNIELAWRRKGVEDIFQKHIQCVKDLKTKQSPCIPLLKPLCQNAKIQSAMVNRMIMDSVPYILNSFPDLHVIHVVRDPRAIVFSRLERNSIWDGSCNDTLVEAEYLCYLMKNDIEKKEKFETKYPGVFTTVKYEDHFRHEVNSTNKLYDFIGQDMHADLSQWLHNQDPSSQNGKKSAPVKTIEKWRTSLPKHIREALTSRCANVLKRLGYDL